MNEPQAAFPLDSTPSNADGKVEGAEMGGDEFLRYLDGIAGNLIQRQKLNGWRPIAEAKKDGSIVLGFRKGWVDAYALVHYDRDYDDWISNSHGDWSGITHFQPLPEPPTL